MKKTIYCLSFLTLLMSGCHKKNNSDIKDNGLPKVETKSNHSTNLPIAYVEIDSISQNYKFCIEEQEKLKSKQMALQRQLTNDGQRLQSGMASFQEKLQTGKFKSQQEAEAAQANLQKQQQALAKKQASSEEEMSKLTIDYQTKLRKKINTFLANHYKEKYSMILTNSEAAINVLYASPALDITTEVIEGLNQEYK